MDWACRQKLLEKAYENGVRGRYCRADIYLLRNLLLGEHGAFYGRHWYERYHAIWVMVSDPYKVALMEDHHVINHVIKLLQETDPHGTLVHPAWVRRLLEPTTIRHSVLIPVSTEGGHFAKLLGGGGKEDLGIVQTHYHCRAGLEDEYNIGFNNPAIIDISPPILQ
eukprot:125002-Karenia_brevis.AAC.1